MSIIVNPPQPVSLYRRDSATSATPLVPSLDPADYGYGSGNSVTGALDELFKASAPKGFQVYTSYLEGPDFTFVVPVGVTEVLVLSIGQGGYPQSFNVKQTWTRQDKPGGEGGLACSAYFSVTPGQKIPVVVDRSGLAQGTTFHYGSAALPPGTNSFNGIRFTEDMENKVFSLRAGNGGTSASYQRSTTRWTSKKGGGGGSFQCSDTIPPKQDRDNWLSVALGGARGEGDAPTAGGDASVTGSVVSSGANGKGWPFPGAPTAEGYALVVVSKDGTPHSLSFGGGGGGSSTPSPGSGGVADGSGNQWQLGGVAAPGAVMIFWGPDIRPETPATPTT